jgi:alginate O-acetyltransferase complex protein AlgI
VLFSSPAFLVFFAVYCCLHLFVPSRRRIWLIIGGSTIFYAWWKVEYTWLPYALMAIAYGGVRWMERANHETGRRRRAAATIVVLFLPLLIFKYTNFVYRDVAGPLLGWRGTLLHLPLPLGVSFVTFTLTAFVVDTFRRRFPSGQRASTVLAYVLFFPHLIAGPILRPHELIPQLDRPRPATLRRFAVPLAIFTAGLVKKLVFADQIAEAVDLVYTSHAPVTAPAALLAIYGFSAQIYCDFSGYTDMAIGLALLLGVRLPNNFLRPYAAPSLIEFWRRWHVTLSYWLRDYLYIPLGGSRGGPRKEARNVVITMTLGGLWHGANWTFVVWGVLHGVGVLCAHWFKRWFTGPTGALARIAGVLITFHVVTVLWVFFRAASVSDAARVLASPFLGAWIGTGSYLADNVFVVLLIAVFFAVHRFDDHRRIRAAVRYVRPEILWPALGLLWMIAIAVSQGSSAKFIYFDF